MIEQLQNFFLVIPPGFEKLAVSELNLKLPGLNILSVEKGGLLVESPLPIALSFNSVLKIPTAVRLRIAEFKCRDFPKLFNKIQSIRWNQFLVGDNYELAVECSKSRLLNEKRVEETVKEGITRFFAKQPAKKQKEPFAFSVHVRFFDDVCTLSLDLSGEPLFKRGYKTMAGLAPIRENLAAGLFYSLWVQSKGAFDTLIDPMCGTASFLLEAQLFSKKNKARTFAYEHKKDWVAAEADATELGPTYFYGFDQSEKTLQAAVESVGSAHIEKSRWILAKRDLFSDDQFKIESQRRAIICNPPYGERLKLSDKPEIYYPKLFKALVRFEPQIIGVVVPLKFAKLWPKKADGFTQLEPLEFSNGGIQVVFLIYKR
jgi:putative N6-adenine-specific DNA methylase